MQRFLLVALVVVGAGYLALCAALFLFQRSLLYYPQPAAHDTAASTETLRVADATIRLSVRELPGPRAVLYFGGNAEDVSADLPAFASTFPDASLYLLHYRGYGGSGGRPSERALVADALALFDRVHPAHPEITVIGRSLGSGIAIRLATVRPVTRLVLVTPYASIAELAARAFPWLPVRWLILDRYESWRDAPRVMAPTTILAAGRDEVIPRASTERLVSCFGPGIATCRVIPGAGHNSISERPEYWTILAAAR